MFNELLLNYTTTKDFRTVPVSFPMVTVRGFRASDRRQRTSTSVAGTETSSQGNSLDQRTFEFTDNLTIPVGSHQHHARYEEPLLRPVNLFGQNSLGNWTFASPAAFRRARRQLLGERSVAHRSRQRTRDVQGQPVFLLLQDAWQSNDRC